MKPPVHPSPRTSAPPPTDLYTAFWLQFNAACARAAVRRNQFRRDRHHGANRFMNSIRFAPVWIMPGVFAVFFLIFSATAFVHYRFPRLVTLLGYNCAMLGGMTLLLFSVTFIILVQEYSGFPGPYHWQLVLLC